jgi:hypothetical protein
MSSTPPGATTAEILDPGGRPSAPTSRVPLATGTPVTRTGIDLTAKGYMTQAEATRFKDEILGLKNGVE